MLHKQCFSNTLQGKVLDQEAFHLQTKMYIYIENMNRCQGREAAAAVARSPRSQCRLYQEKNHPIVSKCQVKVTCPRFSQYVHAQRIRRYSYVMIPIQNILSKRALV